MMMIRVQFSIEMTVICTTSSQLISLVISGCMSLHSLKVFFRIGRSFAIRFEENMVATLWAFHMEY